MHAVKLVLNALMIGALNLASFVLGFWIFKLSASGAQRLVQGTAAMIIGVSLVVGWLVLFRKFNRLQVEFDFLKVFLLVFVLTPVLFVPVHYVLTGYLTGIGNIIAIGTYQFPMNALALTIGAALVKRREKTPQGGLSSELN